MALQRRLLQFQSLLAQQALRTAVPKPRLPSNPHTRFVHCPSPPAAASPFPSSHILWRSSGSTGSSAASPFPSSHILWRSSGSTGSLLRMSAAAIAASVRAAAARWLTTRGAASLELFSLQRRRSSGWQSSSSRFLRRAPWANWIPSADGMVLMLVSANVAVYMLWRLADPSFMKKHFMISLDNFKSGRLHTLLTSAFSHTHQGHLFSNMIGLYFFGSSITNMFGPAFLLNLYMAGAIAGSIFFLLEKAYRASGQQVYQGWDSSRTSGLGASTAVNAIILLRIFLNPRELIYVYFILPVPAALVGAVFIGVDLWRVNKGQGPVSGSGHLGGALVAALAWARIRKGWI